MADIIYSPSNFIKQVDNSRLIRIQDRLGETTISIDYTEFASGIPDGRVLIITKSDTTVLRLTFSSNENVLEALSILVTLVGQLKDGTYIEPEILPSATNDYIAVDYSETYSSTNFIQGVNSNLIQIQNRDATKITYSIDYRNVTTTLVNSRFLTIYQTNASAISLQFSSNSEALTGHDIFRNTVDQLKDNTYNTVNNVVDDAKYDPDTFIYVIRYEDFSVQLQNKNEEITHTIVAQQVTSVYTSANILKVKTEATDTILSLIFASSEDAILAASNLRSAIKEITDRIPDDSGSGGDGDGVKSFSADFTDDEWLLVPDIAFSLSGFSLEYFELTCPTGGSCATEDLVKRDCRGLVEYNGDFATDTLQSVKISFNQTVSGRAILISK